ncbi:LptF/LptG family permease [Symmachiella dynata]|uniref:Putative permease YjgP/YjgQ family protein n=1 Tax=Symmachiella dynata TaxID=2527995 RepID=A0A517ZNJ6_9PLAN|nr:LptF/LptG family permease [Symmachiella dynata]QDU44045.1 putative permease YjgP/YjgQ family protein [Symmachiella dynata]
MRLLQRYVLFELLRVFAIALTGLTLMLTFVGVIGEATRNGLGPKLILQILPFIVPSLMPFTIPATLLLTVTVVYGRMSGDQEITAIKAAGINVMSIIMPSIIIGLALSLGTFILTDQFIPWAKGRTKQIVATGMEDIFLDILRAKHKFVEDKMGIAINVLDVDGRTLIGPRIHFKRGSGEAIHIEAESAKLGFDTEKNEIRLRLWNGTVNTPGNAGLRFVQEDKSFPLPRDISEMHPRDISISRIYSEIDVTTMKRDAEEHRRIIQTAFSLTHGNFEALDTQPFIPGQWENVYAQRRAKKLHTEIHSRYALAASCFFFVLLGSSFSIYHGRSQFLTNFFVCFMPVLLFYYPVVMLMINLSKTGSVNPLWGMWVGNAGLFVAGIFMLRKVLQH